MYNSQISRVLRSKAEARSAYDRLSRWYDLLAGRAEKRIAEIGLEMLGVHQGDRVLEIGFGTGSSILSLARSIGASGRVCGLDISAGMLEVTRGKLHKYGLSSKVELLLGDATRLPYREETFDSIFMSFTLELFDTPEIPVVLSECRRVLRDGGLICLVAMSKKGNRMAISLYEWVHRLLPKYVDCRPIFLAEILKDTDFGILGSKVVKMWGLPVEIALAATQSANPG